MKAMASLDFRYGDPILLNGGFFFIIPGGITDIIPAIFTAYVVQNNAQEPGTGCFQMLPGIFYYLAGIKTGTYYQDHTVNQARQNTGIGYRHNGR